MLTIIAFTLISGRPFSTTISAIKSEDQVRISRTYTDPLRVMKPFSVNSITRVVQQKPLPLSYVAVNGSPVTGCTAKSISWSKKGPVNLARMVALIASAIAVDQTLSETTLTDFIVSHNTPLCFS
jgi:hypothetical protein